MSRHVIELPAGVTIDEVLASHPGTVDITDSTISVPIPTSVFSKNDVMHVIATVNGWTKDVPDTEPTHSTETLATKADAILRIGELEAAGNAKVNPVAVADGSWILNIYRIGTHPNEHTQEEFAMGRIGQLMGQQFSAAVIRMKQAEATAELSPIAKALVAF